MFKNYLKTALRNIWRQRLASFINLVGLACGLAFCILASWFVRSEWTYDTFHENAGRLYRVYGVQKIANGETFRAARAPIPLGPALKQEFPEVEHAVRFCDHELLISTGEKSLSERVLFADDTFFQAFTFPFSMGDPATALHSPNAVVMSEKAAKKYFGNENPMGKRISIKSPSGEWLQDFVVTGIAKPLPVNSTIRFDLLLSYKNVKTLFGWDTSDWYPFSNTTLYLLLRNRAKPAALEAKFPLLTAKSMNALYFQRIGVPQFRLQPLEAIHLDQDIMGPPREATGNKLYSLILALLAFLVLVLACINFINLSAAQSSARAREVGIRKIAGAQRWQLLKQFWGESVVLAMAALLIGIALAELFFPTFQNLVQKNLALVSYTDIMALLLFSGLIIIVGLIAGSYPALIFSSFRPIEVLRSRLKFTGSNFFSRALVVFQFSLSIVLIISTFVMAGQVRFLNAKDLGFNTKQVVLISTKNLERGNRQFLEIYKNELAQYEGIIKVSGITRFLDKTIGGGRIENIAGEKVVFRGYYIDYDFIETLQLDLGAGRNFSRDFASDATDAVIVNESLVKAMAWNTAIGRALPFQLSTALENPQSGEPYFVKNPKVIGVVKDYHFQSLHHQIEPIALFLNPHSVGSEVLVRISSQNIPATIALLEKTWRKYAPHIPFEFSLLDEKLGQQYQHEQRWTCVITYTAFFAIFIACLGAFGLITLAANRKTKEIGIRKVLGATMANVITLLSKDFIKLVLLANVIAWPVAWFAMQRWLENFAYRIEIGWWVFALAGGLALVIALLTVSTQAIRAALANPVEALRHE